MSDGPLLNDVTRAFAEAHRNEDVRDLALKTKRTADLDLPAALDASTKRCIRTPRMVAFAVPGNHLDKHSIMLPSKGNAVIKKLICAA